MYVVPSSGQTGISIACGKRLRGAPGKNLELPPEGDIRPLYNISTLYTQGVQYVSSHTQTHTHKHTHTHTNRPVQILMRAHRHKHTHSDTQIKLFCLCAVSGEH